jgi:hypothetical protein
MSESKPGSHRGKEDVSYIGEVVGKTDGGYIEIKLFPVLLLIKEHSKERWEKVVGGVGTVGKFREKRGSDLFQEQSRMIAKD